MHLKPRARTWGLLGAKRNDILHTVIVMNTMIPIAHAQEQAETIVRYVNDHGFAMIHIVTDTIMSPLAMIGVLSVFTLLIAMVAYLAIGILLLLFFSR